MDDTTVTDTDPSHYFGSQPGITLEKATNGIDADGFRQDYLKEVAAFRETYRRECFQSGIDYVALDTSMQFDKALVEYLARRSARG